MADDQNQNLNNGLKIDYERIIGYILSMLFGLVFRDIITNFGNIKQGINRHPQQAYSEELTIALTIVFCANTFRMLHGFVLSMYDPENPTSLGPYPYDFKELFVLVLTFFAPLIAMICIQWETNNHFWILLSYQLPMFIYLIWDSLLYRQLRQKKDDKDEETSRKVKRYFKYTYIWLLIDFISLGLAVFIVGMQVAQLIDIDYNVILFVSLVINLLIFIIDYHYNRDFYFRQKK